MPLKTTRHAFALLLSVALIGFTAAFSASPAYAAPADDGDVSADIVGGGTVADAKPWIAALHANGGFRCTASQITSTWIITAAHCVESDTDAYTVRIGSLTRSSGGTVRTIDQVIRHPNFDWPTSDIAVLHMSQPFVNTYVALAEQSGDVALNQEATIYGWGSENPDWSGPLPENLKYADGYVSDTTCFDADAPSAPLVCTQTDGSVAGGDSGGPAFVLSPRTGDYVQVGVCAVGYQPAGNGIAGWTSIPRHWSWLTANTDL